VRSASRSAIWSAWGGFHDFWFRAADARVYGLLRITLAAAALLNLGVLWPERYRLFARDGSLAPLASLRDAWQPGFYSLFHDFGSHLAVDVTFGVGAIVLVSLLLGIAPRLAAIFAWLFHLNYTRWAFYDLTGWDNLLRGSFFLLAFFPAGDPYCLEYRWQQKPAPQTRPRYGLLLLRWQVLVMYLSTVWLKADNFHWRRGDVLGYFHASVFSKVDLSWSFRFPATLAFVTYATLLLELALPFLLLSKRWRALGFALGLALHGWIGLTTEVGIFSVVTLATYPAFLDGDDLDRVDAWWQTFRGRVLGSS
jgi:hypothetical protein